MIRTLVTKRCAQGILAWRHIHDKAARGEVPRLTRSRRAQHIEFVTSMAVRQNAPQVRGNADRRWPGLWAAMASSIASTQARRNGKGLPITLVIPLCGRVIGDTRGMSRRFSPDVQGRVTYNDIKVAGRAVQRRRIEQSDIRSWIARPSYPPPGETSRTKNLIIEYNALGMIADKRGPALRLAAFAWASYHRQNRPKL
jgi:hypothetical protein